MAVPLKVSSGSSVAATLAEWNFSLRGTPHRVKPICMGTGVSIRKVRSADAESVSRIYIDSGRHSPPLVVPARVVNGRTVKGQTARGPTAITVGTREVVLVAED